MKKFIKKIAAMAISSVMCLTSTMPAFAATAQDYVPTVDLNNGISLASATTGSPEDYGTSDNGMSIYIVDTNYNMLDKFDTSKLVTGNMGGVIAPTTKTYNNTNYTFSHFEYATSVRNYVASYNSQFEFYVDPPMTILAVYTTTTPNPPEGPVVGMYKDPMVIDGKTFYYCSEAAKGADLSSARPSITFGRSALNSSETGNEETFNTQAANIYDTRNNNSYQFIVASGIINNGPINFQANVTGAQSMAQIKNWNFGSPAFENVTVNTSRNGITLTNVDTVTSNSVVSIGGKVFSKGFNTNASFTVYKGDVVKVYADGAVSATNGTVQTTGNATTPTTIIASANGTMTINNNGSTIYGITVNMYSSVDSNSATTEGGGSTEASEDTWAYMDTQTTTPSWLDLSNGSVVTFPTDRDATFTENIFGTTNACAGQGGISFDKGTFTVTTTSDNQKVKLYMVRNGSGTSEITVTSDTGTANPDTFTAQKRDAVNLLPFETTLSKAGTYTFKCGANGTMIFRAVLITPGSGSGSDPITTTTGTITGYVKDSAANSAISGATVTLSDGQTTTTAINGAYSFTVTIGDNNDYTVSASKTGYTAQNTANVTAKAGSTRADDLLLTAESSEITTEETTTTEITETTTESVEITDIKIMPSDTGYKFSAVDTANTTGFLTTDSNYGGAYYQQYTGSFSNPVLTTPTDNNYVKIQNGTAYIYDNSTDITKMFMPMTNTVKGYTTGTVTISGSLQPSVAANKWSVLSLEDENNAEIAVIRIDTTDKYAIATPAATDYNYVSTNVAGNTDKINYKLRIDYNNKKAYLSINNGSEVSINITNTNGIAKLVAVTAHGGIRNLTVGDITISYNGSTVTDPTTGTISGNVTNKNNSEKLANILVELLLGTDQSVVASKNTDSNGNYSFNDITFGSDYILRFAKDSLDFISETLNITGFNSDKTDANISLTPKTETPTTVEATISVEPAEAKIKINGTEYSNDGKITLTIGNSYTVTSADTSAYTLTSVTPSTTFTATESTTAINANLTAVSTPPTPSGSERIWNFTTNSTLSSYVYSSSNKEVSTDDGFKYRGNGSNDKILTDGTAPYTNYLQFGGGGSATGRHFEIADVSAGDIVTIIYGKSTTSDRTLTFIDGSETNVITDLEHTSSLATPAATPITYEVKNDGALKFYFSNNNVSIFEVSIKPGTPPTTGTVIVNVKNQNGVAVTGATLTGIDGFTENSGVYTATNITPGTYTVTASKNGVSNSTESFAVEAGLKYTKDIVLTFNNGSIKLNVNDGTNPITNATVTADGITFTNSGNGVYTATGVADGTYNISVSNGTDTKTTSVTVTAGSNEEKTVSFLSGSMAKMDEYLNIILARSTSVPYWNTESGKFDKNTWHYVNGAMVTALLDMYEATGDKRYSDFATGSMDVSIKSDGSFVANDMKNYINGKEQLDGVREMTDFDRMYILTKNNKYNTAADYIYKNVLSPIDRITAAQDPNAVGSFSHKNTYQYQIWLDGFFMGFPFYMQYANYKNDSAMVDDVYTQFKNLYNVDRDATTGLYYHGYNGGSTDLNWAKANSHSQSFWLRSSAWLAMAYPDTLEFMPEGTQKEDMKKWFKEYMDNVLNYQDPTTGMWRQVIDKGDVSINKDGHTYDNYFETSGSAGMAAALMKGYRLGYLNDIKYYNAGLKAFEGICENKLYYSDTATSDIYKISVDNNTTSGIDWITPWEVTSSNNSGSENIGKYMILKDVCRVGSLGSTTTTTNYGTNPVKDGSMEYYLQEFKVDNDGKAIAPLVRAYSEVIIHNNGGSKKITLK